MGHLEDLEAEYLDQMWLVSELQKQWNAERGPITPLGDGPIPKSSQRLQEIEAQMPGAWEEYERLRDAYWQARAQQE